jgi:hypothetical protein
MSVRVRALHLVATATLGQQIQGNPAAEARLDAFLRSLPVAGRPRFMPDRIAEIEVVASVARLIEALRAVRPHLPAKQQWPLEELDQISVRLKTDQLAVVGRGMPAEEFLRPSREKDTRCRFPERPEGWPAETTPGVFVADQRPPPDWAALVLEAAATADRPDQALDEAQARLLASRAAKVRARDLLRRQLDEVRLADGLTVRERAAKDDAFAQDCRLLLDSARVVASRPADGKRWEVRLQLPLGRMAQFAAP